MIETIPFKQIIFYLKGSPNLDRVSNLKIHKRICKNNLGFNTLKGQSYKIKNGNNPKPRLFKLKLY